MKRWGVILLVLVLGTIFYYSLSSGTNEEAYKALIQKERQDKDDFMKTSEDSPFREAPAFGGLKYFEPDSRYRIRASLSPVENKKVVTLQTSSGEQTRYLEYAWATFVLDDIENKLLLLEVMDMGPQRGKLFLGFADATSAAETYGGGRYLDIKKIPAASSIELDFNKAYNPFCAYVDKYSCPLPPRENILSVGIRAGEKSYK